MRLLYDKTELNTSDISYRKFVLFVLFSTLHARHHDKLSGTLEPSTLGHKILALVKIEHNVVRISCVQRNEYPLYQEIHHSSRLIYQIKQASYCDSALS